MNIITGKLRAIKDHVIINEMKFDRPVSKGGIILPEDNGKSDGVRPRWGKVYAVGPEQKEVAVDQWILVAHGRWTRGVDLRETDKDDPIIVRRVDISDIIAVSDEAPLDHER